MRHVTTPGSRVVSLVVGRSVMAVGPLVMVVGQPGKLSGRHFGHNCELSWPPSSSPG